YFNLAAEHWWTFSDRLAKSGWRVPAADEVLRRQLCSREQNWVLDPEGKKRYGRADGKLQLQPKARSGKPSPDRADALVGAAYDHPSAEPQDYLSKNAGAATPGFPHAAPSL